MALSPPHYNRRNWSKYSLDDISLQQITIPLDLKQYTIKEGDAATAAGKGDDLWSSDLE